MLGSLRGPSLTSFLPCGGQLTTHPPGTSPAEFVHARRSTSGRSRSERRMKLDPTARPKTRKRQSRAMIRWSDCSMRLGRCHSNADRRSAARYRRPRRTSPRKQPRLVVERGRAGQPDGLFRRELPQAAIDLQVVQDRLVDIEDRNLHGRRQAEHLLGDLCHATMPGVQRMEGPGENRPRRGDSPLACLPYPAGWERGRGRGQCLNSLNPAQEQILPWRRRGNFSISTRSSSNSGNSRRRSTPQASATALSTMRLTICSSSWRVRASFSNSNDQCRV